MKITLVIHGVRVEESYPEDMEESIYGHGEVPLQAFLSGELSSLLRQAKLMATNSYGLVVDVNYIPSDGEVIKIALPLEEEKDDEQWFGFTSGD